MQVRVHRVTLELPGQPCTATSRAHAFQQETNMKKIVYIVGGIIVLLLAAIVILPFVIDVNRFRPDIERLMSEALNRKVTIGNIQLSILSGGVAVADLAIADDPAFSRDAVLDGEIGDGGRGDVAADHVASAARDRPHDRSAAGHASAQRRGHVEFFDHRRVAGRRKTGARATAGGKPWFRRRGAGTGDSELCHPQRCRERRECRVESAIAQVRAGESDGVESFLHDAISL